MTYKRAIDILRRKTSIPGDGYSFDEISEAFDLAIRVLSEEGV